MYRSSVMVRCEGTVFLCTGKRSRKRGCSTGQDGTSEVRQEESAALPDEEDTLEAAAAGISLTNLEVSNTCPVKCQLHCNLEQGLKCDLAQLVKPDMLVWKSFTNLGSSIPACRTPPAELLRKAVG
jgi:hypothetical protein